ncbi:hypothetical protein BA763_06855 [Burkholderia cenocepacia]|nr:hypothetical protein BA763_06855 [Burkholderia cenocepacia]
MCTKICRSTRAHVRQALRRCATRPAHRCDGRTHRRDRAVVTRDLHAMPRIMMHRNDAPGRSPVAPI